MSHLPFLFLCPVNSYLLSIPRQQLLLMIWKSFLSPCTTRSIRSRFSAGEMTEYIVEIPVVQEQVIVQKIPDVVVPLLPAEEFSAPVYDQVHQVQIAASEMTVDIVEIPVVHEQVIVGTRPERLVDARGPHGGLERAACPRSEVGPLLAPPVLAGGDGLDESALAFLVQQTLLARDKEEAELEEKVAVADGRLLVELQREREGGSRISRQSWATLSRVESRRRRRWLVDVISSRPCI